MWLLLLLLLLLLTEEVKEALKVCVICQGHTATDKLQSWTSPLPHAALCYRHRPESRDGLVYLISSFVVGKLIGPSVNTASYITELRSVMIWIHKSSSQSMIPGRNILKPSWKTVLKISYNDSTASLRNCSGSSRHESQKIFLLH